jgi:3-oxoacyl-[acyl-carrier protein] reductase
VADTTKTLAGKVALVTGGSRGIGAAIARRLASAGAAVALTYQASPAKAEEVVRGIKAQGGTALAIKANSADAGEVTTAVDRTAAELGGLDILVNNAGVYQISPLEGITEDEFHRQFNTNVLGVLLATQEAARYFGDGGGSVINISSVVSELNLPQWAIYTATKGAVDSVTRVLAKELGPRKIRVNSINPGVIETEGTNAAGIIGGDAEKQLVAQTPLGRTGTPDDIAPVAVFLASDDSRWLTGETLAASGGLQ